MCVGWAKKTPYGKVKQFSALYNHLFHAFVASVSTTNIYICEFSQIQEKLTDKETEKEDEEDNTIVAMAMVSKWKMKIEREIYVLSS